MLRIVTFDRRCVVRATGAGDVDVSLLEEEVGNVVHVLAVMSGSINSLLAMR